MANFVVTLTPLLLFATDDAGADLIEYAFLTAIIATGCVVGLTGVAASVVAMFQSLVDSVTAQLQ
jgi:Flp pilus assembly pilin Flp